jgi:hypothetical protein
MRSKKRIESAHALKPARKGDFNDWQIGFCEQLFSQEQSLRLCQLDWRDPKVLLDRSSQLPARESQVVSKTLYISAVIQSTRFDPPGRRSGGPPDRIDRRVSRSELRTTTQAGPKSLPLRQGRIRKKSASGPAHRPGSADRPAINRRRRDPNKEQAVKTGVTRGQGSIAGLIVDSHEWSLTAVQPYVWPFSDIEINLM